MGDLINYSISAVAKPTLAPVIVAYKILRELNLTLLQDKVFLINGAIADVDFFLLLIEVFSLIIVLWSNWFDPIINDDLW